MYVYDRKPSGVQSLLQEQSVTPQPALRNSYFFERGIDRFEGRGRSRGSYVGANESLGQFSKERLHWPLLSDDQDKAEQRKGTQVLYVRPTPPRPRMIGKIEYKWSFDTAEGRTEYEAALDKHLKDKKIVSGKPVYEPLSSSADIAKLASNKFANLVLIVHGAANGPAIGVNLGSSAAGTKADWIKDDKFADVIAPLTYTNITILGCDSVSNKFTPNLAKRLPKGSTVIGHKGGSFEITRHFEPNRKIPGKLQLTRVRSNLRLKAFKN